MALSAKPRVHVIGTGGTFSAIGRSRTDYVNYGGPGRHLLIQEMIDRIPEITELADVHAEQYANVLSGGILPQDWLRMANRINEIFDDADAAGVVVTHGTATLEETAYFLNLTVRHRRPVVVTGAMRPPTSLGTDADVNLFDSIRVAAAPAAADKGALVVLNNEIHAAREVSKSNSSRVDTFRSPDLGCLGYADGDQRVVFYRLPARKHTWATEFDARRIDILPRVEIEFAYAGADGASVRNRIAGGARGIVLGGLGSGNAPADVTDALCEARARGVIVVITTHTGSGRARHNEWAVEQGFIGADNLTPKKARILLMLALSVTADPLEIQRIMFEY